MRECNDCDIWPVDKRRLEASVRCAVSRRTKAAECNPGLGLP